jgi:hypothetical protein
LSIKNQKNLWGYIDREGKEIIPPAYKAVSPAFSEGYAAILGDSKLWGFIDTEGNVTAKPQFKAVLTPFSEGLSGVKTIDGNGYARPDGTIAFMADYDQLFPFKDGLAEVREGEVETHAVRSLPPISIGIGWGWGDWLSFRHHPWGWGWGIGLPIWYPGRYDYEPVTSVTEKRGYIDKNGKVIASHANDRVFSAGRKGILLSKDGRYGWVAKAPTSLIPSIPVSSPMRKTAYFSPKTKTRNGASSPWKTVTNFCHSPIRRSDPWAVVFSVIRKRTNGASQTKKGHASPPPSTSPYRKQEKASFPLRQRTAGASSRLRVMKPSLMTTPFPTSPPSPPVSPASRSKANGGSLIRREHM